MRPNTLVAVSERIEAGEDPEKALAEFLDEFYSAREAHAAYRMIAAEPQELNDVRLDALLAAVADYLCLQFVQRPPPPWTSHPKRVLAEPFFTVKTASPGMREWLVHNSPAEFKAHNIFTEARPLRRKMSGRVAFAAAGDSPGR